MFLIPHWLAIWQSSGMLEMQSALRKKFDVGRSIKLSEELSFIQPRWFFFGWEAKACRVMWRLAFETYCAVCAVATPKDDRQLMSVLKLDPEGTITFLQELGSRVTLPDGIIERWLQWQRMFQKLVARQPRLELYYALNAFFGRYPWPNGAEWRALDWVAAGKFTTPFVSTDLGAVTPALYEKLRSLRAASGGWICQTQYGKARLVFVPEADLSAMRARHLTEEHERFKQEKESDIETAFRFAPNEEAARRKFVRLAIDTYDLVKDLGRPLHLYNLGVIAKVDVLESLQASSEIPVALVARWHDWNADYATLLVRHPKQGLYNALLSMGQARHKFDQAQFPTDKLWQILDWVESGAYRPLPTEDARGIITADFYTQLRSLRSASGGWFVRRHIFVPDSELQATRTKEVCDARDQFIRNAAAEMQGELEFAPGEEAVAWQFEQLALETYDVLTALGDTLFLPSVHGAYAMKLLIAQESRSPALAPLIVRWQQWREEFAALIRRHPRKELRDMLQAVSESHDSSSWPAGYEWKISNWVDSGNLEPVPFEDRQNIATPEFYARLRALKGICQGWFNYRGDKLVFLAEADWQEVRAWQESEWLKWQNARYFERD